DAGGGVCAAIFFTLDDANHADIHYRFVQQYRFVYPLMSVDCSSARGERINDIVVDPARYITGLLSDFFAGRGDFDEHAGAQKQKHTGFI
ncbi:MAG: hypothetical protein PVF09_15455, partial [Desulfobacterales bacterium]